MGIPEALAEEDVEDAIGVEARPGARHCPHCGKQLPHAALESRDGHRHPAGRG
jgi:hypothetical protein